MVSKKVEGLSAVLRPIRYDLLNSEVCHPRCAFKLHGEVDSVKKHNYKIWLNDGVY